jgi:3-dehydro-L-gulonate 2-dehydrogenase
MIAAVMALGQATHQLAPDPLLEVGISQIFLTMNPQALGTTARADQIADEIVDSLHDARPVAEGERVRYPGEQTLRVRAENEKLGLPVEPAVWEQILAM